jgi:hypothetical protein
MAKKQKTSTLADISISMSRKETDISLTTVKRRLNKQGLYKLKPLLKPLLLDTYRDNRLKWARANRNTDWSKVIFTDEISISQFSRPKKVWRQKGEIVKVPTVKHSGKVHVYRYFSKKRFGNIYCFTNNLNSDLLCTIYKTTLLPSAGIFLARIIIVGFYKRIMILNIPLEKLRNRGRIIRLRGFLGQHKVQT